MIFEAAKAILPPELDEDALNSLRRIYSPRCINTRLPSTIDFNTNANRDVYIYMYFTSLTRGVAYILDRFWDHLAIQNLFNSFLNVCAIGGGPGTDILGIKLFLMSKDVDITIDGTVLDFYLRWEDTFNNLMVNLPFENVTASYQWFNFKNPILSDDTRQAIETANLVTLVKVISGLSAEICESVKKLTQILENVKPGAVVLFIDNSSGPYFDVMRAAALAAGLNCIDEFRNADNVVIRPIPDAESREITKYYRKAGCCKLHPQKYLKICAAVWQMPRQNVFDLL